MNTAEIVVDGLVLRPDHVREMRRELETLRAELQQAKDEREEALRRRDAWRSRAAAAEAQRVALADTAAAVARCRDELAARVGHLAWVGGMVLGIAEGAPQWEAVVEEPGAEGVPAIRAVKALRRQLEVAEAEGVRLQARVTELEAARAVLVDEPRS